MKMDNPYYEDLNSFNVQHFIAQKKSSIILLMIPHELINAEIVFSAAKANGMAIRHAPAHLLTQRSMEAAVMQNFRSFSLIPKRLVYARLIAVFSVSLFQNLQENKFLSMSS